MSLLTALIAKTSHIWAGIYIFILIKRPRPNLKGIQNHIWTSVKGWESSSQVTQMLAVFSKLFTKKALDLQKLSNRSNLNGFGASQKQKTVSRDNHLQNM